MTIWTAWAFAGNDLAEPATLSPELKAKIESLQSKSAPVPQETRTVVLDEQTGMAITLPVVNEAVSLGSEATAEDRRYGRVLPGDSGIYRPVQVKTMKRLAQPRTVTTIDDLERGYVMTYPTFVGTNDGTSLNISKIGADSLLLTNFLNEGMIVKARVDMEARTVTIANQVTGNNPTYGKVDIAAAYYDTDKQRFMPSRQTAIVGTINADGTISFDQMMAIWIKYGEYANYYFASASALSTLVQPANGTMQSKVYDTNEVHDWNVIVAQPRKNVATVLNFANHGHNIEVVLNSDKTINIDMQEAWTDEVTYYTRPLDCETGHIPGYEILGTGTEHSISFGGWILFLNAYFNLDFYESGQITTDFTLTYPSFPSSFKGSGTASNPYQVSTPEDVMAIAEQTNSNTDYIYQDGNGAYAKPFKGKHFKMMNDIDMSEYYYRPIGNSLSQRFAAIFNGDGHSIKNLTVTSSYNNYLGMFGVTSTEFTVKNLTLDDVNIECGGSYGGSIAGALFGIIDNCHVKGIVGAGGSCVGGLVGGGTYISNSSFEGIVVSLTGVVGGIAGDLYGSIENSNFKGQVFASYSFAGYPQYLKTGGIAAVVNDGAILSGCYSLGSVIGLYSNTNKIGGIAGVVDGGGVSNCFTAMLVHDEGTGPNVGGLVGWLSGQLTDSYSTGCVQSLSATGGSGGTGGITGHVTKNSLVKNCYYAGSLSTRASRFKEADISRPETTGNTNANATIENVYFDCQMTDYNSDLGRLTTAQLTSVEGVDGFSSDDWVFAEGYYPRLKSFADLDAAKFSASALMLDATIPDHTTCVMHDAQLLLLGNTQAYILKNGNTLDLNGIAGSIEGNSYRMNGNFGTDTLAFFDGTYTRLYPLTVAPKVFEGNGTADDPFLIRNKQELMQLGDITTNHGITYQNVYFQQTADIDLELDPAFVGIAAGNITYEGEYTGHAPFGGIYDGDNHTIHKMFMEKKTHNEGYGGGFVGTLGAQGILRNLRMAADCQLSFYNVSGAFIGLNYGRVEKCRNYAQVLGYDQVVGNHTTKIGGIVGYSRSGSTITDCYNAGHIAACGPDVGGIAGCVEGITLARCMNVGLIEGAPMDDGLVHAHAYLAGLTKIGGIAGEVAWDDGNLIAATDLLNAGTVRVLQGDGGSRVGGIFGKELAMKMIDEMNRVVNYGAILSNQNRDYPLFFMSDTLTAHNIYYDKQLLKNETVDNGVAQPAITACTTAELTSGSALEGLSGDVWDFAYGQYPVLRQFADEPMAQAARKVILNIREAETARLLRHDASFSAGEGATWQLTQGNAFAIDGNTLKVPVDLDDYVADTLMVRCNGYEKDIALYYMTALPVEGDGTADNPYRIRTAQQWNDFATYCKNTSYYLDGLYVSIEDDLDFTDIDMVSFHNFGGHLLGNGKSFNNINVYKKTGEEASCGVFHRLRNGSSVSDLTLNGTITYESGVVVNSLNDGGAFGFACYAIGATFTNCRNNINISVQSNAAGFVRQSTNSTFINCSNHGDISGTQRVAGFIAEGGTTMNGCHNYGAIDGSEICAGIVAYTDKMTMKDCDNHADVTASEQGVNYFSHTGGLIGKTGTTPIIVLDSCFNEGTVTNGSGLIGYTQALDMKHCHNSGDIINGSGLVGLLSFSSLSDHGVSCIYDSYNEGSILNGSGIVGQTGNGRSDERRITVSKCYNKGDIMSTLGDVGGIMGVQYAYNLIDSCYNLGNIFSEGIDVGGIVGQGSNRSVIAHSWNVGSVTGTQGVGGIVGLNRTAVDSVNRITDCFNAGTITATTSYSGGLGGYPCVVFTNCYNVGSVGGDHYAGGLVGAPTKRYDDGYGTVGEYGTSFYHCYNAGKMTADTLNGNIVSLLALGDVELWNPDEGNVIENTCYVTDWGTWEVDEQVDATPLTIAQLAAADDLAGDWDYGDEYTLPIISGFADNDCAKAFAAAVVLADGDTYDCVSRPMHLGLPEGVTWTSSNPIVQISGNVARATAMSQEEVTLTATCGDFRHDWKLTLNWTTGVDVPTTGKAVVKTTYYNISGREIAKPQAGDSLIYLQVDTYTDGTTRTTKHINR